MKRYFLFIFPLCFLLFSSPVFAATTTYVVNPYDYGKLGVVSYLYGFGSIIKNGEISTLECYYTNAVIPRSDTKIYCQANKFGDGWTRIWYLDSSNNPVYMPFTCLHLVWNNTTNAIINPWFVQSDYGSDSHGGCAPVISLMSVHCNRTIYDSGTGSVLVYPDVMNPSNSIPTPIKPSDGIERPPSRSDYSDDILGSMKFGFDTVIYYISFPFKYLGTLFTNISSVFSGLVDSLAGFGTNMQGLFSFLPSPIPQLIFLFMVLSLVVGVYRLIRG